MKRRTFLAGVGAATAVSLAGCLGDRGTSDAAGGQPTTGDGPGISQRTIDTIDAHGSSAGQIALPVDGQVTVVDMFATWCAPCKPTLDNLAVARTQTSGDVRFVSVTSEVLTEQFTKAEIAEWWAEHGGEWTVGHDAGAQLTRHLNANNLPTTFVFDAERVQTWRHTGVPSTDDIVEQVEAASQD